jgi:hypothetical protein
MRKKSKWTMLLTYLISFVLVLAMAGNASAAAAKEWEGDINSRWDVAGNWRPDGVPLANQTAEVNLPDVNCLIDSSVTAVCQELTVGYDEATCYLDMTGGSLTTNYNVIVGDEPNANGVFTISDGNISCDRLWVGYGGSSPPEPNYAVGTFNMAGGNVTVASKVELGKNLTGVGTIYVDGGTITLTGDNFEIGKYGNGTLEMTAGDINVAQQNVKMSEGDGTATINMYGGSILANDLRLNWTSPTAGTATLNLYDGDVNVEDLKMYMGSVKPTIDIYDGTLVVTNEGTWEEPVKQHIIDGWIIGYGGAGIVEITGPGGGIGALIITAKLGDPNLAWSPNPANYETLQWTPTGPTLEWLPAQAGNADTHDVYFGTDRDDVNDANRVDDPEGVLVSQGQDPCSYGPLGPLVVGETYYWRIDEVNGTDIWKGDIWQFQIAAYVDVEDFESYANEAALETVWGLTGSDIDINDTIVNTRLGKSMRYDYNNVGSPFYTEASANTSGTNSLDVITQDWVAPDVNVKVLTLYFYGDVNNDTEQMYVALRDTDGNLATVYYGGDINDVNEPEWHEWNIILTDFNSPNDVNLSDVNKVYVGFGNRESPAAGGTGTVYFDDIRLYPRRCVPLYGPVGDIGAEGETVDNDCIVDLIDLSVMTSDWRDKDPTRAGSNGELKGGASWVSDGTRGNCIELDGINGWVDLDDDDFSNFRNKTIAFWVKVLNYPSSYRYMFSFSDESDYRIYFMTYIPEEYRVRMRFIEDYSSDYVAGLNVWTHLAFVVEDAAAGMCTGTFFADGYRRLPVMSGQPRHSGEAKWVNLGSAKDGVGDFVNARFDDFRVYDYALSSDEVKYLGTNGASGVAPNNNLMLLYYAFDETVGDIAYNSSTYTYYHPLLSKAELYDGEAVGSREINFRDLAILVDDWLEEKLWP